MQIQHPSTADTVISVAGTTFTITAWVGNAAPFVVFLSAIVTIGFTMHRWIRMARDKKHKIPNGDY